MNRTVLSSHLFGFWKQNGYVVIKNAVPKAQISNAVNAIWEFLEMDRNTPPDWYDETIRCKSGIDSRGIIPLYHHQALWDSRQSPKIYDAFAEIYNTKELLVSIDRVNMNPPKSANWNYSGFIHWDIDVSQKPLPFQLQGLLSLTDTDTNSGGFQCVPAFHLEIENWLGQRPEGFNSRFPDTTGMNITPVPLKAGDFLIWDGKLPHGNTENTSGVPRLAQYITMFPQQQADEHIKNSRITSFETNSPPLSIQGKPFPKSPKDFNTKSPVQLTSLGRKLLGTEPW